MRAPGVRFRKVLTIEHLQAGGTYSVSFAHIRSLLAHIRSLMALLSLFRVPHAPREGALSYEETASSTASLTAADCARMDNFIFTVLF